MRGFKSIFVSSKHKIKCFLIHEKYFQMTNAVDTLPLRNDKIVAENSHCLTRAHPVVSAEHQRPGGGGVDFRPPLRSRKLRRLEKNGKRRLVDWEKHYKKHSDNFSLKSKLRSPGSKNTKIFCFSRRLT